MRYLSPFTFAVALHALAVGPAWALPMIGDYIEDPLRCDPVTNRRLTHELGDAAVFPLNEGILLNLAQTNVTVCVPDDGLPNDWRVTITNISGQAWQDLFFVVDGNSSVGNADGMVADPFNAAIPPTDAFRIDGTVTVTGMNDNLISESINTNEIFENGEAWEFYVSNFVNPGNLPPLFASFGYGFASTQGNSTASILANPIPEPAACSVLALGAVSLLRRWPRRARAVVG
jgi:hypothetical protein